MRFFIMPWGWYEQTQERKICIPKSLHWKYECLVQYFPGKRFCAVGRAVRRKSTTRIYRDGYSEIARLFRNSAEKWERYKTAFSAITTRSLYEPFSKIRASKLEERRKTGESQITFQRRLPEVRPAIRWTYIK